MLEIAELFFSLQGEGPFIGRPAVFVRLSRCMPPLCPWCDTVHAWGEGERRAVADIVEQVLGYDCSLVVITGGEPFLQWNSGLSRLEETLVAAGRTVQYETSGKVRLPRQSQGFIVCSPKFLGEKWHFVEENLAVVDVFKFVVDDDFEIVDEFVAKRKIPATKVWVMPMGASRVAQLERFAGVWRYCMERGFSFSPRLHTLAFDDKKGV